MRVFALMLGLALGLSAATAQELVTVTWPTAYASPPATLPQSASEFLPALRIGLSLMPESNVVALAMSQPALLGLSSGDANRLKQFLAERYRLIQRDPAFRNAPSALPYCFSAEKPPAGRALVYVPRRVDTNAPALIFLHGYGGSFLWAQQLLAEAFPDRVIICPAYGISAATMPSTYLTECLGAVQKKLGRPIRRPILMGISDGGFGAVNIYIRLPAQFSRLIVLGAYPPENTWHHFDKTMSVRFLVGAKEDYVQSGFFNQCLQSIKPRVKDLAYRAIPDGDQFFLVAKKDDAGKTLRSWVENPR